MSWEHDLAGWIKDQGKTGGIETGYLVGNVISPKWSEADEAWTDGELIISTLEGQAMLTEGMLDRLDAGGELHDGMTVALIPGARALRGGQRFFVAEIPGHGALPGRDSPDCHPIEAITGLRDELDDHDDRLDHLETIRVPALEHDMNEAGGRVPVLEGRVEALEDLESALGEDLSDLSDRVDGIVIPDCLPLAGGTLTGSLTLDPTGASAPILTLVNAEKSGVGASRMTLRKNASASADNGTQLTDYIWGDGTTANARLVLVLSRNANLNANLIRLIKYDDGGTYTTYQLYGQHNLPTIANVTGLEARLAAIEDRLTALEGG